MKCCNSYGKCTQGPNCPVRAARDSGVCATDGDPVSTKEAALIYLIIAAFCAVLAAVVAGAVVFAAVV